MTSIPDSEARSAVANVDPNPTNRKSAFRVANVIKFATPLAVLLTLGAWLWTSYGDEQVFTKLFQPPLIEAHGIVLINGEPLDNAEVITAPLRKGLSGAFGMTDKKGRFTLQTLSHTTALSGAYAGIHKVGVVAYQPTQQAFGSPATRTPMQFRDPNRSAVTITVSRNPAQNQDIRIELEGELIPISPTPEMLRVTAVLKQFDVNKSGQLEANEIPHEGQAAFLASADSDGNGILDQAELLDSIRRHSSQGSRNGPNGMTQIGAGFIVGHIFESHDNNDDGVLDKTEISEMSAENLRHSRANTADTNADGVVDRKELTAAIQTK